MRDQYDYIIVGAGSAGCALANRLSADPGCSVLLVESGPPDDSLFVHMPRGLGVTNNPGSKYIWEYQVRTGSRYPEERWFRGRTLGGSSSVNGMIYMRGAPIDYDGWAATGCAGWSWADVGRKFIELEDHDLGAGDWRGEGGLQRITTHPKGDPLTWTDALRVVFEGKRATGVVVRDKQGAVTVRAAREIIISAGAIQTPKLLQLSGVGPAGLLAPLGIEVVADSPDVGRNLREHRHADLRLRVRSHSQNQDFSGANVLRSLIQYLLLRNGPMTHAAHEIGGFAKSEAGLDHADLQFGLMSLSASSTGKNGSIALDSYPGITFVTYFTRPESQGEVRIQSADPDAAPVIDVNHLSVEIDQRKFIAAFRWNRRLAQQPALRNWVVEETYPAEKVRTDEEILAHAMDLGGSCFHTAGTARMGADASSVVDPELRVRGVEGLRVADTSIMPTLVSGNTNGPAMMIGLRAADFILREP